MPLATALPTLQSDFIKIFKSQPPTAAQVADQLASAYFKYAANAVCAGGAVVLLPSQKALMSGTLLAAIATPLAGAPPVIAAAWGAAYTAFWMAPPVAIAGAALGAVTAATGAAVLVPTLTALFANPLNTEQVAGVGLAMALHAATMLVLATVSVGGAPPVVSPLL